MKHLGFWRCGLAQFENKGRLNLPLPSDLNVYLPLRHMTTVIRIVIITMMMVMMMAILLR